MIRWLGFAVLGLVLAACDAPIDVPDTGAPRVQLAEAKVLSAGKKCWIRNRAAFRQAFGQYTFRLSNGEVGTCDGDDRPKKSYTPTAPYVERNQVAGRSLPQGARYLISGQVAFDPAFASAGDTNFFQIGQWNGDKCQCAPYVRLMLNGRGDVFAQVLKKPGKTTNYRLKGWTRSDLEKGWVEVAVALDTRVKNGALQVYLGGQQVLDTRARVQSGGVVALRTGLLRPGDTARVLPTDQIRVRELKYAVLP